MELFGNSDRRIAYWLIIVAIMIYCMVILGGVTRLTGSGLSMVQWQPIMGTIPPLSQQEWQSSFEKYKQYPEYKQLNRDMDLSEFKRPWGRHLQIRSSEKLTAFFIVGVKGPRPGHFHLSVVAGPALHGGQQKYDLPVLFSLPGLGQ